MLSPPASDFFHFFVVFGKILVKLSIFASNSKVDAPYIYEIPGNSGLTGLREMDSEINDVVQLYVL